MFILVIILFQEGAYKTAIDPSMYETVGQCEIAEEVTYERLMSSRPTESSYVLTHCLQLPRGV